MEPEGSLPCSQKPATGPYPEFNKNTMHSFNCRFFVCFKPICYITSNGRAIMNDEFEKMWTAAAVAYFKVGYYTCICLKMKSN
jgi:hypothetical protein